MKQQIVNILLKHSNKGMNHATLSSNCFELVAEEIISIIPAGKKEEVKQNESKANYNSYRRK